MGLAESVKGAIGKLAARHKEREEDKKESLSATHHKVSHREEKEDGKKKHVGFKGAEKSVESEGYSKKIAGAIIASKSRGASKEAHKENPRLNRVKG